MNSWNVPTAGSLCCRPESDSEVIEHRDQGATRGQQQPSSLSSQLVPSLATPGAKKRTSAKYLEREKEQKAGELEEEETHKRRGEQEEDSREEPPPHCCPLGKSSLLPPPHDYSGPFSTAACLLVTKTSRATQSLHATSHHPSSHPDRVPNSGKVLSTWKSRFPLGSAEPAHVWSHPQKGLSQTHMGSFSSHGRHTSHMWRQSMLA